MDTRIRNLLKELMIYLIIFVTGYAFHGAPWRSDFGYSASHGCVNMPSADAQWIYNWAEIGTTVVSH